MTNEKNIAVIPEVEAELVFVETPSYPRKILRTSIVAQLQKHIPMVAMGDAFHGREKKKSTKFADKREIQQAEILKALRSCGICTRKQLVENTGLTLEKVQPRVKELQQVEKISISCVRGRYSYKILEEN